LLGSAEHYFLRLYFFRTQVGIRVTIIAHNREQQGVVIEEDAALGAGVIVLPNVTIGPGRDCRRRKRRH
jgi:serine acetyltransferase